MKLPSLSSIALLAFMVLGNSSSADVLRASPPSRSSLEVYDLGYAWVTELRRLAISEGENTIHFGDLPSTLVPGTATMLSSGRSSSMEILEQQYQYSLENPDRLLDAMRGQNVEATRDGDLFTGKLIHAVLNDDGISADVLLQEGSSPRWIRGTQSLKLLNPTEDWVTEPRLSWKVTSDAQQSASLRLTYQALDFDWSASYGLILDREGSSASFSGKVALDNKTDKAIEQARVTIVRTEQGETGSLLTASAEKVSNRLRYDLTHSDPRFEQQLLGPAGLSRHTLEKPVTVGAHRRVFIPLLDIPELPVSLMYVYDGVLFDQFQRNRRNDWNYGTESQPTVDVYLTYEDLRRFNVKKALPGGRLRVFEKGADGGLMLIGDDLVESIPIRGEGQIRIGTAPTIIGARERIGYAEVTPLHEYEESFEIRLENIGETEATVKVIEHLYRWPEYEIVKSDGEYVEEGPQKISFSVLLKPGGSRSIHYSVRYRW